MLRELLAESVRRAGGKVVEGRFVLEPGVFVAHSDPEASPTMREVSRLWGIDAEQPYFSLMAEAAATITYLNPASKKQTGPAYVHRVLQKGHRSIAGQTFVTLGLFGIPLEITIELLSHGLDTTARLTSSAVKAMDDPLFCVYGPEELRAKQIELLSRITEVHETLPDRELSNAMWPGNRAAFLFVGMRLIDWDKLLSKRLPRDGNEAALRVVCQAICRRLRERYPAVIREPESYGWDGW